MADSQHKGDAEQLSQEGWQTCLHEMRKHDQRMIKDWNEEIDALLLFAALFSAVVTTFVVQSYPGLQPDPTQTSTEILTRISMQLSSLTVNQGFINSTIPAANLQKVEQFTPSTSSVVVNLLWFTSLVFSLVSALCGIFTRQWLRQYAGWEVSSARQSVRLRQFRYNGLQRWGVPHIMTFLPILLQLSLVLFFAGLIEILWSLHRTIAIVLTVIVSVSLALVLASAMAPILDRECPYRSPLSWVLYRLYVPFAWISAYVNRIWTMLLLSGRSVRLGWRLYLSVVFDSEDITQTLAKEMPSEWTTRDLYTISAGLVDSHATRCDKDALAWIHGCRFDTRSREQVLLLCLKDLHPLDQPRLVFELAAAASGNHLSPFLRRLRSGAWNPSGPDRGSVSDMYLRMAILAYSEAPKDRETPGQGPISRLDVMLLLDYLQWRCSPGVIQAEYWPFLVDRLQDRVISEEQSYRIQSAILDLATRYPHIARFSDAHVLLRWAAVMLPGRGNTRQTAVPLVQYDREENLPLVSGPPPTIRYEDIVDAVLRLIASMSSRSVPLTEESQNVLNELLRGAGDHVLRSGKPNAHLWCRSLLEPIYEISTANPGVVPGQMVHALNMSCLSSKTAIPDKEHALIERLRKSVGLPSMADSLGRGTLAGRTLTTP